MRRRLAFDDDVCVDPTPPVQFVEVDAAGVDWFTDERGRRFTLFDPFRFIRVDGGVLFQDACRQLEAAGRRSPGVG